MIIEREGVGEEEEERWGRRRGRRGW